MEALLNRADEYAPQDVQKDYNTRIESLEDMSDGNNVRQVGNDMPVSQEKNEVIPEATVEGGIAASVGVRTSQYEVNQDSGHARVQTQ